jgi:hypothetical protein
MVTLLVASFLVAQGHIAGSIPNMLGAPFDPVTNSAVASGELPRGWSDNSAWAKLRIAYSRRVDAPKPYLRIDVRAIESGRCQVSWPLGAFEPTSFEVEFTARSLKRSQLDIQLRQAGAPYTDRYTKRFALGAEWKQYRYVFRAERTSDDVLLLIVNEPGQIDLSQFQVNTQTPEAAEAALLQRAAVPTGNLMRHSRFPLGIGTGWCLVSGQDDKGTELVGDPSTKGPSGYATLRFSAPSQKTLYSEPVPIPIRAGQHWASVWVKGSGRGALRAVTSETVLGQTEFKATKDWQRIVVGFQPQQNSKAHGLQIVAEGSLWLDEFQVERGPAATPYKSASACEVALRSRSPLRVQFPDEPPTIEFVVTGQSQKGRLRMRLTNVLGETFSYPAIPLSGQRAQAGTIRTDVFPKHPLGASRLEAWVEDGNGRKLSTETECVVVTVRRPRHPKEDDPSGAIGTHLEAIERHLKLAKMIGASWARLHDSGTDYIGWHYLETNRGQWTFRDEELSRYRQNGLKILGALSTSPMWASNGPPTSNDYFNRFGEPNDWAAWSNYVSKVVDRYRSSIDAWDVWNEPWIAEYWYERRQGEQFLRSADPPGDYAKLSALAFKGARQANPGATVLGINSTSGEASRPNWGGSEWSTAVAKAGGMSTCDVIAYHDYPNGQLGFVGDAVDVGFRQATGPLRGTNYAPKPVWLTEGSPVYGRSFSGMYKFANPEGSTDDPLDVSDRLARYILSARSLGVKKVFLYSMHTYGWFDNSNDYRTLVNEDGFAHPSASAVANLAWLLDGLEPVSRGDVLPGLTAYVFSGPSRTMVALCPHGGSAKLRLPKGAVACDVFGNGLSTGAPISSSTVYVWSAARLYPSSIVAH